jgi:hypothetical protein
MIDPKALHEAIGLVLAGIAALLGEVMPSPLTVRPCAVRAAKGSCWNIGFIISGWPIPPLGTPMSC